MSDGGLIALTFGGQILQLTVDELPLTLELRCTPSEVESATLGDCKATVTIERPPRRRFRRTYPCRAIVKEDVLAVIEAAIRDIATRRRPDWR